VEMVGVSNTEKGIEGEQGASRRGADRNWYLKGN